MAIRAGDKAIRLQEQSPQGDDNGRITAELGQPQCLCFQLCRVEESEPLQSRRPDMEDHFNTC